MPPYAGKRKRDDYDSSDDEPLLGRQVLPIANLPDNFNGEPMDGAEYLFTVRRDSRMLPHTTRVENPYEIVPQPSVAMSNKVRPALPSEEWRATLERRFKNFRKNSTQPTIHVFKPIDEKVIPEKKDRDAWYAFLAGLPESEWNPPKKPKVSKARDRYGRVMRGFSEDQVSTQSDETWRVNEEGEVEMAVTADPSESLPTPSGSPAPQQSTSPREPTPHLLKYIDDKTSLHLLMYFTYWINIQLEKSQIIDIPDTYSRWIFALLARVDDFVSADDMNLLRNLARACTSLLKELVRKRVKTRGMEELQVLDLANGEAKSMERFMDGCRRLIMRARQIISFRVERDVKLE